MSESYSSYGQYRSFCVMKSKPSDPAAIKKGQLKIKKKAIGTKHIDLWEKLTMDDEPSKREYESEMEYIMKGGFLRPRDSSVHQEGWLPPIYRTYSLSLYSVRGVFSLALFKIFPFCSFICPPRCVRPLTALASSLLPRTTFGPHATRVVCPALVPLLSLFCMPDERRTWAAGSRDS